MRWVAAVGWPWCRRLPVFPVTVPNSSPQPSLTVPVCAQEGMARVGRLQLPWSMFAFPFYLWKRSPGKTGSHYDPDCDLFVPAERNMVLTSNAFMIGMLGIIGASAIKLGIPAILNLYVLPYWLFVVWLDVVTYLHHHGSHDAMEKMPWYRGEVSEEGGGGAWVCELPFCHRSADEVRSRGPKWGRQAPVSAPRGPSSPCAEWKAA